MLVMGTGALGYRAYDQGVFSAGDGAAFDPWRTWQDDDGPLALVAAAILAASPHNTQPWSFRVTDSSVDLFADPARNLGAADPLRRELYVGLGCAVENLVVAAGGNGYAPSVRLMPDPADPAHVASIALAPAPSRRSPLYSAIPERHTNRYAFAAGRDVPQPQLDAMTALADETPGTRMFWFAAEPRRARIGELLVAATEAFIADDEQSRGAFTWFRQDWDTFVRSRDGTNVDTAGLSDLVTSVAKIMPVQSRAASDRAWRDATRDTHVRTAAAYGVVAVPDASSNPQRLQGGRVLQRVHLWATANGVALHHMNQITERADRERQLGTAPTFETVARELIGDRRWEWLSAFRIGYPAHDGRHGPRRPVEEVTLL
jgi:hypothetical protein